MNLTKFLAPIITAAIQAQMTSKIPGLSKREKVIKIATDSLTTAETSGLIPEGRVQAIVEDGQEVIAQANDIFVKAMRLKAESETLFKQGQALLDTLKDFGKVEDDPLS